MTWDGDKAEVLAHVALEDGLRHAQCDVRPDVEQRPAKLLHRHRVHVPSHRQRREPVHPRLVVGPHRLEQLLQLLLLKPSIVIQIVQVPAHAPNKSFQQPSSPRYQERTKKERKRGYNLGEAEIMTSLEKRSGREMAARAPTTAETEWPTKMQEVTPSSSRMARRS